MKKITPPLLLILATFKSVTAQIVSALPPWNIYCGIRADGLHLTDIPGVLHIDLSRYNNECGDEAAFTGPEPAEIKRIEVDWNNGIWRYSDLEAVAVLKPPPLDGGYTPTNSLGVRVQDLSHQTGSNRITVRYASGGLVLPMDDDFIEAGNGGTRDRDRNLVSYFDVTYLLSNFDDSVLDDNNTGDDYDYLYTVQAPTVVHFYSEKFSPKRIFFVYPIADGSTGVASCAAVENGSCFYFYSDFEYSRIDRRSTNFVYDQMQLVKFKENLPYYKLSYMNNVYRYGLFTEDTVSPVIVLSDPDNLYENADPRNNMAYNMKLLSGSTGASGYVLDRESIDDPKENAIQTAFVITLEAHELKQVFDGSSTMSISEPDYITSKQQTRLVNGNMFDIVAKKSIVVSSMFLHIASTETHEVQVYLRKGGLSFQGRERHPGAWDLHISTQMTGLGPGALAGISATAFTEFTVLKDGTQGFYVRTSTGSFMGETKAGATGTVYSSNDDLLCFVGVGKPDYFSSGSESDMMWNGGLSYTIVTDNTIIAPVESSGADNDLDLNISISLLVLATSVLGIGMMSFALF